MKKTTILALFVCLIANFAKADATTPTWEYPQAQLWWEWTSKGSSQFGDINNDGNLDLLLVHGNKTELFEYNDKWYGNRIFSGLDNLYQGFGQWIDYNNDGYLDFIIVAATDRDKPQSSSKVALYKNVNGTSFEKDETNSNVLAAAKVYVPKDGIQPYRIACGDFNNDGWTDVVISGQPADDYGHWRLTKLFWNNQGTFAADESGVIEQVNNNGASVADFDNDGHMDFVVGGYADTAGKDVTDVYFSNGDKTFSQLRLDGCEGGNLLVTDVNNDGRQDILVSGYGAFDGIGLYLNNGDRTFTFKSNSEIGLGKDDWGLTSCRSYMVAGDLNNDGYNDIVTHATWDGSGKYTYILLNNGDCTFTRNTEHKNVSVREGGVSIFDYNHDGRLDVHVYGYGEVGSDNPYGDNGGWFNNIMANTTVTTAYTAPVMPGNGICEQVGEDVVLTWGAATDAITGDKGIRYNVYAKNKETGMVMMVAPANIATGTLKYYNHAAFINGTTYTFKGINVEDYEFGVQAINNGFVASAFVPCEKFEPEFVPTWNYPQAQLWWEWTSKGSSQFGDINNDGNLDLLLVHGNKTELFEYNDKWYGNRIFSGLDNLYQGFGQWIDYNNDGYLDFIIVAATDRDKPQSSSKVALYKNVNGTSFEKDETNSNVLAAAKVYVPKDGIQPYRIACGDFNNDGWTDVVISGQPADDYGHWRLTKLFWNNQGTFAADESGVIEQVNNNGASVADFDNDGHMDFVVGGYADTAGKDVTDVYFSNGDKTFSQLRLDGCEGGNLLVTDVNNDGRQDILVSGYGAFDGIGLYLNNGDRTFTFKSNSEIGLGKDDWGLTSCRSYMVAGDLNNDGYNDIVTHATWDGSGKYTYILLNNGDCTFTRNTEHKNVSVREGGVSIFDYNHDGRLDVHVYGYGEVGSDNPYGDNGGWFNNIMENTTKTYIYTAPTMGNAYYEQVDNDVKLTWDAAIDGITGENGIRYNVYAKNKTTGEIATVAPANIATGTLKATNHGSFLNNTTYTFKGIIAEEYEFGVQAINNGNIASAFTACVLNPYSSVEEVAAETVKVVAQNCIIRIANNGDAADYAVYAINGMQVAAGNAAANAVVTLNVDKGIYIVKVGAQAFKVIL